MTMNNSIKYLCVLLLGCLAGLSSCSSDDATSTDTKPTVYAVDAKIAGKTYAEWSAAWWQWALQTRVHDAANPNLITHPLRDTTGQFASNGQTAGSPVYFLGGWLFGGDSLVRSVTIASNQNVFIPVLNFEVDTTGGWTRDSMIATLTMLESVPVTVSAQIDGQAIANVDKYKMRSPDFSVTLGEDNAYQLIGNILPAGQVLNPVIGSGYYLMIGSFTKGQHTLHIRGEVPSFGLTQDITYKITVN